ncbi:Ig-like V-type domain-containing protein FAM187A [Mya arenaria]|uniref:Ig-like V-type domain-containing protein FAM187A n=1 Tax=Mya arenaria TaxID=6604 RepID=UPI0022E2EB2C|nr:Ig-like V-type domain-containing protein FAM187A [Mya arenaria]
MSRGNDVITQKTTMNSANVILVITAFLCSILNETQGSLPDDILPVHQGRGKRSVSADKFSKLQGNWKYSKEEVTKMFDDYYKCITERNKPENRVRQSITAVLAMQGQRIDLQCPFCQRPDQDAEMNKMFWQRVRVSDSSTSHISPKTKGLKIKQDMSLIIQSVDVTDAGQYFCIRDSDAVVIYQVDVLFREPQLSVRENETFRLQPARRLVDHNLEVYSHWSEWGECDTCDRPGRRNKFGTCMVNKIHKERPITPVDVPIIFQYPKGVPCRSTVLPRAVAHLLGIRERKSELVQGKCSDPCPTTPGPVRVTDKTGKVVEVLAGGYHPIGRKPNLPPLVIRKVRYAIKGTHIVLVCPTSKNSKVRWQRGERAINPRTIRRQTKGRVYLDRLNRLHIWKLRERDSAPYNCWVWKRHTATIKVLVYEGMDHNLKHYITYGGLVLTVVAILTFCICKVFCRPPRRHK